MERASIVPVLYDDGDNVFPPSTECTIPAYLGMNDPQARADLAKRLNLLQPPPLLDRDAHKGTGCWIGYGSVLAADVRLVRDVVIGNHTHLNYQVSATRTHIGDFTTIAPGVTICGDVWIGDRVFVGAGATVCNLISIGDGAVIGAGSTVIGDVPAGARVMGVWKPCLSSR